MKVNFLGRFQFLLSTAVLLSALLIPALATGQTVPTNQVASGGGIGYRNSVSVPLPNLQIAGGLNVVVVGWNDSTSTIGSVTDSNNNTYFLAAGTMDATLPDVSQAIYVASNIKAGANTVTVTFNSFTGAQDVRVVEYSGPPFLENTTFPLDTVVGNTGTVSPASTGPLTTTYANDVIVAGGTITTGFASTITNCGTGCSLFVEIPPTSPFFDVVVDAEVTTAPGPYQARVNTAGGGGGNWVMQMVAVRVAGQTTIVNPAPTVTSVVPGTNLPEAGGTPIVITGTGFLAGANAVISDGTNTASAVNCVFANSTTMNCVSPDFPTGTSPNLVVTNPDGQAAAGFAVTFAASTPFTSVAGGVSPNAGFTDGGSGITITGSEFAAGAEVFVGPTRADKVTVVNSGTITAVVPAGSVGPQNILVQNPSRANGSPGTFTYSTGSGVNFVQGNSARAVSAPFTLPQAAGDLNVVVIGWGDTTSTITSVTDSAGNTYAPAVAPTQGTGLTQAIYYAKNIKASAANTNTVTVTFNAAPNAPDLRIVEYSGLDTVSPLDGNGVGASGTSIAMDSGSVTPISVGDMIIGAGTVAGVIAVPGNACFGSSCAFATAVYSADGNNVEHAFPTVAGPYDGTGTQDKALPWVMQAVAFRQPTGALPDFTIGASPSLATVTAGNSTSPITVTVTPSGGFNSAVALTCTGVPNGAACNFNPTSVTPGAGAVTSSLTISTAASTPVGLANVVITGTSGSVVHTTPFALTVAAVGSGNFTLTANPTSASVAAGSSATSTITINPTGGFAGTVNLSCAVTGGGTPAPVCSLPATATTTATLTVSTTAPHAALMHSSSVFYAMLLPLGGMTLLGVSFGSRRKKVLGLLLMFLMVSGLLFLSACGGGSSTTTTPPPSGGTPAGAYTVTVTGTSGSLTAQTTTFTLTVQ